MIDPSLHVCELRLEHWEPQRPYDIWLHEVVNEHSELALCAFDCGELQSNGVALKISDRWLLVHLEKTRCEGCEKIAGVAAIPDTPSGTQAYKDIVFSLPVKRCPHCNIELRRRMVVWLVPYE